METKSSQNSSHLIKATSWEVLVEGDTRRIQLFDADGNKVDGKDAYWEGSFDCSYNQLTSLEGAPSAVGGSFYCHRNQLTTLEGAPSEIGLWFDCSRNQLTSLKGAPSEIGLWFDCSHNQLTSLDGLPKLIGGEVYSTGNPINEK